MTVFASRSTSTGSIPATVRTSFAIAVRQWPQENFTLGQFFGIWGVRFTPNAVGGYRGCRLYVDGKRYGRNAATLKLREHQQIALVFGKAPATIPASNSFPAGE